MANFHRLTVGEIECVVIHEGATTFAASDLAGRYPNATEEMVMAALDAIGASKEQAESHLNCLYIQTGGTRILADTGFGEKRPAPVGQAIPSLKAAGIQPEEIDIVYLTHFHGDHIIGLVTEDGSPTFSNARYVTMQIEWDHWMKTWAESDQEHHQQMLAMMQSLQERFSFVSDGDEVAAGVTAILAPGHSPGHSGLLVESGGEQLLDLVDMLHNTTQFLHPEWHFKFDTDGALAERTRRAQLERCASEKLFTMFYHLPFPGLGHVVKEGDSYRWQPIV